MAETYFSNLNETSNADKHMTFDRSSGQHIAAGMTSATTVSHRKTVALQKNFTRGTVNANNSPKSITLKQSRGASLMTRDGAASMTIEDSAAQPSQVNLKIVSNN